MRGAVRLVKAVWRRKHVQWGWIRAINELRGRRIKEMVEAMRLGVVGGASVARVCIGLLACWLAGCRTDACGAFVDPFAWDVCCVVLCCRSNEHTRTAVFRNIERRRLGAKLVEKLRQMRLMNRVQAHCRGFAARDRFRVLQEKNAHVVECATKVGALAGVHRAVVA